MCRSTQVLFTQVFSLKSNKLKLFHIKCFVLNYEEKGDFNTVDHQRRILKNQNLVEVFI
jgi:hypothetical protein